ncbi:MAG: glycoside hydrolase family 3 protein [Treponema sp.]|jgi:beta-N-acetylhexosaminidase|nr:glycoside hydrolase family 3 protein [Treponema sp.]
MIRLNPALGVFLIAAAFSGACSGARGDGRASAHRREQGIAARAESAPAADTASGAADAVNTADAVEAADAVDAADTVEDADADTETQYAVWRAYAAELAAALDDRLLAAQVIMAGLDGKEKLGPAMRDIYRAVPPGAVMLFRYNLDSDKAAVRALLSECSAFIAEAGMNGIRPFMAADHEGGGVHRFGAGVERLPGAASYRKIALEQGRGRALALVEADARRSAQEIRALGVTLNLAPVAEILTPDNEAFLMERSYGSDAGFTGDAAAAFIRGMAASGVACIVKHFPGNSAGDPHREQTVLDVDRETLDLLASPFAFLVNAPASHHCRPSGIMLSHSVARARDPFRSASLSPFVIRDWLRGELGFEGIGLGDDFSMPAIALSGMDTEEAAVAALEAGLDMVMVWPKDIVSVHRAIVRALDSGGLSRERLREAAARILCEKLRFGLVEGGRVL